MAELGWTGITFPESCGGSELGYAELGVVLEECGRTLMAQPFLSTVLLAGNAILLGASDTQREELLTGVCEGDTILALAYQERGRFAPYAVSTKGEPGGTGFRLTGQKLFVADGHVADHLIVVARTSGSSGDRDGLSLFLVDPAAQLVDSRNAATVTLDGVEGDGAQLLGTLDRGADILDAVFDRATAGLSAELLGTTQEAFDRTLGYLKTREQFGALIGTFQALKHRAAPMFCEL